MSEGGGYAREKGGSVERDGTMCMSPCVHYVPNILPPPGSVEPEGKQVQTMGRGSILRRPNLAGFLRTKNVYKRGEEEIRKRRWWLVASLLVAAWAAPQWPSC